MNSDYERAMLWGAWPEFHSVYAALLAEMVELNKIGAIIAGCNVFRRKL